MAQEVVNGMLEDLEGTASAAMLRDASKAVFAGLQKRVENIVSKFIMVIPHLFFFCMFTVVDCAVDS